MPVQQTQFSQNIFTKVSWSEGKPSSYKLKTEWSLRSVVKLNNKGIRTPRQERHTEIQMLNFSLRKDVIVQEARTRLRRISD